MPHKPFPYGVTEKPKVISEKLSFFMTINNWNQYNYFLKLE